MKINNKLKNKRAELFATFLVLIALIVFGYLLYSFSLYKPTRIFTNVNSTDYEQWFRLFGNVYSCELLQNINRVTDNDCMLTGNAFAVSCFDNIQENIAKAFEDKLNQTFNDASCYIKNVVHCSFSVNQTLQTSKQSYVVIKPKVRSESSYCLNALLELQKLSEKTKLENSDEIKFKFWNVSIDNNFVTLTSRPFVSPSEKTVKTITLKIALT